MNSIGRIIIFIISSFVFVGCNLIDNNQREDIYLKKGWKFTKNEVKNALSPSFDDSSWEDVKIPHDWAINGPFDQTNDAYKTIVTEDGEKVPKFRLGRTGGLPHIGIGWYRHAFKVPLHKNNKKLFIEFDGAMSHSKIYLNGTYIGEWPYGYTSFSLELTNAVKFGEENVLAVRLENFPKMSRWYPGAGIYRNVRLVYTSQNHIAHWGTYITTPDIEKGKGTVNIKTTIKGNGSCFLLTEIYSPDGKFLKSKKNKVDVKKEHVVNQSIAIDNPKLWSIESPKNYKVLSRVIVNNEIVDTYESGFGYRYFKFTADDGFHLNGKRVQIKGVNLHHDLGPIGTAVNRSAILRQLRILKQMGCNAIRTAHNPPTPELLTACDTMGFIVMDEFLDEWKKPKVVNGYNKLWKEWRNKDLKALIHRDRNHPSVILWSVGNEIKEQYGKKTWEMAKALVDSCHKEDPTRPVSIGLNTYKPSTNNFAEQFDVKGWNYRLDYNKVHKEHPNWALLASETQSTVTTRGFYDIHAIPKKHYKRNNLQCSAYALEYPRWANTPDTGFARLDDNPFIAGEFVWTGFDYLGEPTPYNSEWPTRSSYFGIMDLCGLPKDLFYMYQQRWTNQDVLHILPHWNWSEGQNIPIHAFTNFDAAELFLNGKSYGIQTKDTSKVYSRYRLVWDNIPYEPGIVKIVAFGKNGKPKKETYVETAGKPYAIKLISDNVPIYANGEDLSFVEVQVVDKKGSVCPWANNDIHFEVKGKGEFKAAGNGNPTDLEPFHSNSRKSFYGKCVAIVEVNEQPGEIVLTATSNNLKKAELKITSLKP